MKLEFRLEIVFAIDVSNNYWRNSSKDLVFDKENFFSENNPRILLKSCRKLSIYVRMATLGEFNELNQNVMGFEEH